MSGVAATRSRRARAWLIAAIAVAALVAGLVLLRLAFPSPGGPRSSSYATGPLGLAAYAELLSRAGHPVTRRRERLDDAPLDPAQTVVLLDPEELLPGEARALRRFVVAGGRLVAGAAAPVPWLRPLLDPPPDWSPDATTRHTPLARVPETAGVRTVTSAGEGSWTDPSATAALGGRSRPLLIVTTIGRGHAALLADPSPLQNRLLGSADDAALGLALAGPPGRPVVFDEAAHGFGEASGLGALPSRWLAALIGVLLATGLAVWARWRRFGPPEPEPASAPARRLYVDAVAASLARTRDPAQASAPLRGAAFGQLTRRAGLALDADPGEAMAAAERLGLTPEEARALLVPPDDERELMAAGRALSHLLGGAR